MKKLIALVLLSALFGCGGGGDGGGTDTTANPVNFAAGNETIRIDRADEYGIDIPSSGNTVTIGAGNTVTHVIITGANNSLIAENSVLIRDLQITGVNNSVSLGTTVTVPNFTIDGANAVVQIGAGDRIDRLAISGANAVVTIKDISASVPVIITSGSNITLRIPFGFGAKTTITNTGANNVVVEQ
jgi:hypothetical protein